MRIEIDEDEARKIIENYLIRFYRFENIIGAKEGDHVWVIEGQNGEKTFCAEVIFP